MQTKHVLPNGFRKLTIHNVKELEILLMHNKQYAAEVCVLGSTVLLLSRAFVSGKFFFCVIGLLQIAHAVSSKKRAAIIARARQLDIKVVNKTARVATEESE